MLANDAGECGRVTSSETPAIGRLGAVTGRCCWTWMHSDFLAHVELVSSRPHIGGLVGIMFHMSHAGEKTY